MTPENFVRWRKRLGLKKKEVAALLGVDPHTIGNYERGHRLEAGHSPVLIPKAVTLAMAAIALGITEHEGGD
jgi:transcriptional regulator with XRE-family HTH domain